MPRTDHAAERPAGERSQSEIARTALDLKISADKLRTAHEIAEYLGEPLERVRYLIRCNLIPYAREGRRIIASRQALREHYAKATGLEPKRARAA
jgi:hypothetical protein